MYAKQIGLQLDDDILFDDFESNLGKWSSTTSSLDNGDLKISDLADHWGRFGLEAIVDDSTAIYLTDESLLDETQYRARFYINLDNLTMAEGDIFKAFRCLTETTEACVVQVLYTSGKKQVRIGITDDASVTTVSPWFDLQSGWNGIEIFWTGGLTGSVNSGSMTLWVNGVETVRLEQVDNDTQKLQSVRLGVVGADAGTSGSVYFDNIESRRFSYIGLLPDRGVEIPAPITPEGWKGANYNYTGAQPHAVTFVERDQAVGDSAPKKDSYVYDNSGNMICRHEWNSETGVYELWQHEYNAENRLSAIKQMSGSDCAENLIGSETDTWTFTYNGDGQRVKEVYVEFVTQKTTTRYFFAGGSYEVEEVDDDGIITTETKRYYSIAGMRVAMKDNLDDVYYFASDHLSSASLVMDSNGVTKINQRFMPFGEVRTDVGVRITDPDAAGYTDFGFTGQRSYMGQSESPGFGLMDFNARFYSPVLGRFTQPDTVIPGLTNSQAWNRYSYTSNNPVKYIDPSGHTPICLDGEQCFDTEPGTYSYLSGSSAGQEYDWSVWDNTGVVSGESDQPGDIEKDVSPESSADAAADYGPCFTCHANKENDHWLSNDELDEIRDRMLLYESIGYGVMLIPTVGVAYGEVVSPLTWAAVADCIRNPICATLTGLGGAEAADGVKFPENPGQTGHIFRDAVGHIAEDTPENRQLLIDTVSPNNLVKVTNFGSELYARLLENGTEVWVEVYNNVISNGGINNPPLHYP